MSSSPYVLSFHDSVEDTDKAVYQVKVPRGERFDTPQFEQITSRSKTEWIWPGRIPLGKVTVIEGGSRAGKSWVAFDFAVRTGGGLPFPDGAPNPWPAVDVLVVSRNDDAERVIEHFQGTGENSRKLFRFTGFSTAAPETEQYGRRPVAFPFDLEALEFYVECHPSIGVVIIDPLSDFCDTPRQFAETLYQLEDLAARGRFALIVTVPATCRTDRQGRLKVSSRWATDAARCVWCIVPDPDDPSRRLFVAKKTNFCREPDGLAFRLDESGVAWEADSKISPDDPVGLMAASDLCLAELLSAGCLPAASVYRLGAELGFSPQELRGAGKRLGVASERVGFSGDGHWVWVLPAERMEDAMTRSVEATSRSRSAEFEAPPDADILSNKSGHAELAAEPFHSADSPPEPPVAEPAHPRSEATETQPATSAVARAETKPNGAEQTAPCPGPTKGTGKHAGRHKGRKARRQRWIESGGDRLGAPKSPVGVGGAAVRADQNGAARSTA